MGRGARRRRRRAGDGPTEGPFALGQDVEFRVVGLDAAGWGEAQVGGAPVRVRMALPGEHAHARVYAWAKGVAQAECVQVADPSPDRVAPRCALFGQCGGCAFQHLAYGAQLDWKRARITGLTHAAWGDAAPAVAPVAPSPRPYGYRSKITPHFHRPRNGVMGPIGFLSGSGGARRVVDVPQCELAMEELNVELARVRRAAAGCAAEYRNGATLLLVAGEEGVTTDPNALVTTRVGAHRFRHRAREFFQNNPFQLPVLVDHVRAMASEDGRPCLIDAYCGCGLFAVACAGRFDAVVGVETSAGSVECAAENARENGVHHARFEHRTAETLFADLGFDGDDVALVLDPPRKGCSPAFLEGLARLAPGRVVYVSCNPAAQMADLRALVTMGYRVRSIRPFDLFPQTPHVECVATLTRG